MRWPISSKNVRRTAAPLAGQVRVCQAHPVAPQLLASGSPTGSQPASVGSSCQRLIAVDSQSSKVIAAAISVVRQPLWYQERSLNFSFSHAPELPVSTGRIIWLCRLAAAKTASSREKLLLPVFLSTMNAE